MNSTSATAKNANADLILTWIDQHNTGKYSGCGRGACKAGHPGVPVSHIPSNLTPTLDRLIATGTVKAIQVTKPHPTDATKTRTLTYVNR